MEGYQNVTSETFPDLGYWEEKTDHRLFWRGSTTGGYNEQRDWKDSHRLRLHLMVNGPKGGDTWWDKQSREVMVPDGSRGFEVVRRWDRVLSRAYTDVKLSGQPVQVGDVTILRKSLAKVSLQCNKPQLCKEVADTIEFGDKIWPDQAVLFKYALDVDGNGWSSRFHRLLSHGSPVIKFTMFPEWHMVC